jgi:hypothetical protein
MVGAENPVIAPTTVLRRSEGTCFSFPSDVEKRASAASTSLSGELLDEGGGIQGAITASAVSNQMLSHRRVAGVG